PTTTSRCIPLAEAHAWTRVRGRRGDSAPAALLRWDGMRSLTDGSAGAVLSREIRSMVPKGGLEPPRVAPHAPQTCASANSATSAPARAQYAVPPRALSIWGQVLHFDIFRRAAPRWRA